MMTGEKIYWRIYLQDLLDQWEVGEFYLLTSIVCVSTAWYIVELQCCPQTIKPTSNMINVPTSGLQDVNWDICEPYLCIIKLDDLPGCLKVVANVLT